MGLGRDHGKIEPLSHVLLRHHSATAVIAEASASVHAVVRHGMAQRTRELGIRTALGATGGDLVTLVAREMLGATGAGLIIGMAGAWGLSRILASQLYEVQAQDVASFALAGGVLVVASALATLIPARRALRLDPMEVIRTE